MERIRISNLKAGHSFAQAIYSLTGQKLLAANVTLTPRHIQTLTNSGEFEVLTASGPEELAAAGVLRRLNSADFHIGQRAGQDIVTPTGHVVVEADQEIEAHHLDALAQGGKVFAASQSATNKRRERMIIADTLVEDLDAEARNLNLRITTQPACDWITPAPATEWPAPAQLTEHRNTQVDLLRMAFARIEAGITTPVETFDPILNDLIQRLSRHPAQFTQLALLCPRRQDYVPDHAYTVTVLAMAIAAQLRWKRDDVRLTGLAAILFDLGMLLVPERIRIGACELTDVDRSRVQKHPVFSLSMLQCVEKTPTIVRLAALQHHERENGSGYPRGTRRDAISDMSRVLAVADIFAATTEPRSYRHMKLPYIAMEETLRAASIMLLYKPAVRGLVHAAGLFPVGSWLKLSDGRNAHVIAANPVRIDRPTVQPLDVDGRAKGEPVDLAAAGNNEIGVVRPLAGPTG